MHAPLKDKQPPPSHEPKYFHLYCTLFFSFLNLHAKLKRHPQRKRGNNNNRYTLKGVSIKCGQFMLCDFLPFHRHHALWFFAISLTSSSISNTGESFRMLKWLLQEQTSFSNQQNVTFRKTIMVWDNYIPATCSAQDHDQQLSADNI